jgi:hypothetical protein
MKSKTRLSHSKLDSALVGIQALQEQIDQAKNRIKALSTDEVIAYAMMKRIIKEEKEKDDKK